ncbi:alpha-mannosidase [Actinomycetaceae bacterium TAE3-ERU4]|nr:alpha-mannosidase [Actinomycetaceae bacterium TAE3-ERU4]
MHGDLSILLKRIDRTLDERIRPAIAKHISDLDVQSWSVPCEEDPQRPGEPVAFEVAKEQSYEPYEIGSPWGIPWQTTWFKMRVVDPASAQRELESTNHHARLELTMDFGWADHSPGFQSEALVRRPDGETIKALNPRNRWVPWDETVSSGQTLWVEAAANPLLLDVHPFLPTEDGDILTSSRKPIYTLRQADVVLVFTEVEALAYDLEVLHGMAVEAGDSAQAWELALACSRAIDRLDLTDIPATAEAARAEIKPLLSRPAHADAPEMAVVGHAHIDSAWLWPIRETRRKVRRTFANVCRLLEDGSDMIFTLPGAQHAAWIEEDDPQLFARIKKLIKEGKIVVVGSMWIEPDAVLPGSEGMARQLTEGAAYFREKLEAECHEIWLPDSFGYSGAIPQLAKLAGVDSFLTQKISWNQHDRFPHHTLWWEGIDGSRVFTHFPPIDTYGAHITAKELHHAEENFKEKGRVNYSLVPFGYGDGGGGPTRDMLERIDRFQNLSGAPKLKHTKPVDFFRRAREEYTDAPVWVGELYLEYHRGTFTSQAETKRGIRESEFALRAAEALATQASLQAGYEYPFEEFTAAWRELLVTHFHDIMPGTSIAWVYREVAQMHERIRELSNRVMHEAAQALAGKGEKPIVFSGIPTNLDISGKVLPAYGSAEVNLESAENIAPAEDGSQYASLRRVSLPAEGVEPASGQVHLSAGGASVVFEPDGSISSYVGVDGREVVPPGQQMGHLEIFQDFPNMWDAWDVDYFYRGSREIISDMRLVETRQDADFAWARVEASFGKSNAVLTWRLSSTGLDVTVDVDWHERERFLKLALPLDLHTDKADFETQFGHITRPIHENLSWDFFRFEVSNHRWLRLAEGDWGVGIANSRTYGWDVTRHEREGGGTYQLVRASLLRGPKYPDPRQDEGSHSFTFSIRPAASLAAAIQSGYELNSALVSVNGKQAPAPLLKVEGAVCESIRMAPDKSGDVLVRLYESLGKRSALRLEAPGFEVARATDLHGGDKPAAGTVLPTLESVEPGVWRSSVRPFEIVTVRLVVKK